MTARRVYLHVGSPKTGTTFLQNVLWQGKERASEQGLLLPMPRQRAHFFGALDVIERPGRVNVRHDLVPGAWGRLVDRVAEWDGDVLISHEMYAAATAEQAARAVGSLTDLGCEVHVVLTVRDYARQLPAEWQERVKNRAGFSFAEFMDRIRDPEHPTGRDMWSLQDYPEIMRRWTQGLPVAQRHVVTVPPPGGPKDLLWRRFAGLVGVDPDSFDLDVKRANSSLAHQQVELLRRVNDELGDRLPFPGSYAGVVKGFYSQGVLERRPGDRLVLGGEDLAYARKVSADAAGQLRDLGVTVTGDLAEMQVPADLDAPELSTARRELDDAALLAEAVGSVADLLERLRLRQERQEADLEKVRAELQAARGQLRASGTRTPAPVRTVRACVGAAARRGRNALRRRSGGPEGTGAER